MYGFGPNAHSSNILVRTTASCSASKLDGSLGSASTICSAALGAMEMIQENIVMALMNAQYRKMLPSLISSLGFTSSEQLSSPPQEGIDSDIPPTNPSYDWYLIMNLLGVVLCLINVGY